MDRENLKDEIITLIVVFLGLAVILGGLIWVANQ